MSRRTHYFGVDMGGSDVTVFLYGCDCGKLKTERLLGLWSEEDMGIEPMKETVK